MQFREKRDMLSAFHEFMTQEIKQKYNLIYDVPKAGFIDNLIPSYAKYLVDIIVRLCSDPANAIQICRIIDLITYENFLNERRVNLNDMWAASQNQKQSIGLAKDFITFTTRAELIDKGSHLGLILH